VAWLNRLGEAVRKLGAGRVVPARKEPAFGTAVPAPAGHPSVVTADPYAFAVAHRRLAWMLRLSAMTNTGLLAVVVVLAHAIGAMAPLKTTEVALVRTYGPDDKLYQVEPVSEHVRGFDLLLESMARRYVKLVLEIDPVTQESRHREAWRMTDRAFWKDFRADHLATEAMARALADGATRVIHVETVTRLEGGGDGHTLVVDVTQVDHRRGQETGRKPLRAYLSMETRPQEVHPEDRYSNPLGIFVRTMVLKEKE